MKAKLCGADESHNGRFWHISWAYRTRVCLFNLKDHYQSLFYYHDPGRGEVEEKGKRDQKQKTKTQMLEPKVLQTHVHSSISHLH